MNLPKIATDDALLFGSLALVAIGTLLVGVSLTANVALSVGAALIVFGVPSFVVTFLAAAEESK